MEDLKNNLVFQNTKHSKIVIYLYRLGYVGILTICGIILLDRSVASNTNMWIIVLIILLIWIKFGNFLKNSAYKIVLNSDENIIKFFMMKNEQPIIKNINEINAVRVNLYIIFYSKNQNIVYNDARNTELVDNLKKYFSVNYGIWGKLLPIFGFKD